MSITVTQLQLQLLLYIVIIAIELQSRIVIDQCLICTTPAHWCT